MEKDEIIEQPISNELNNDNLNDSSINAKVDEKKKISRKEKKENKIKQNYFGEEMNYKMPFSYRHLRVFAWFAFALSQLILVNTFTSKITDGGFINEEFAIIISLLSSIYLPLFIIATYGTILNNTKSFKFVLMIYGCLYIGLAIFVVLLYHRYVNSILKAFVSEKTYRYAGDLFGKRVSFNVFSDLFALSSFYFFVSYKPKKYFQGNKIKIFRSFCLIPLFIALVSFVIKILTNYVSLPIQIYPFLTTKSPLLYVLFVVLVLILKKREKNYLSYGKTKEEYDSYLKTKNNAKSFSNLVCKLLAIMSLVDFIAVVIVIVLFGLDDGLYVLPEYQIGECMFLFLAIPIIKFYNYNKIYEDTKFDIIIPIIGVGLCSLAYLEGIYQTIMYIIG